jgi:transcriptional regulator with XRE-family HTH domain
MAKSENTIDKHVGMRVRRTREFREMSREAFAAELGVSLLQVKKFESGFERIGASQLAAICKSLRVRPSFFFAELKAKGAVETAVSVNGDAALSGDSPIFDLLRKLEAELRAGRPLPAPKHDVPDAPSA